MIKVDRIHIEEFRGIRSLDLALNQENFAVCGPNGTGKSGVVDALEFALTGDISRLSGKGRGALSVKEHGPHVDSKDAPERARVTVEVTIPALKMKATIERSVKAARAPIIVPDEPAIRAVFRNVEQHPEFVLSRREIIKYVLAEPGERAKEVQALLQLDRLETVRATLQRIANACDRDVRPLEQARTFASETLTRAMEITQPKSEAVLSAANRRRTVLGLPPLLRLEGTTSLRDGLESGPASATVSIPKAQAQSDIAAARDALNRLSGEQIAPTLTSARDALERLRADEAKLRDVERAGMLTTALKVFDGEHCPVCETAWDPEHFREAVKRQIQGLEAIAKKRARLEKLLLPIIHEFDRARSTLDVVGRLGQALRPPLQTTKVLACRDDLKRRTQHLQQFLPMADAIASLSSDSGLLRDALLEVAQVAVAVEKLPEPSERDAARDYLTIADERLRAYRTAAAQHASAKQRAAVARTVFDLYGQKTTAALEAIYKQVEKEFRKFYRAINEDDESKFEAHLTPSLGKLGFSVDFYGRGFFPPGAYHSEGHQDGMGLCLYLALMRHLLGEHFTFAVLDDVLMSVDVGHRREVCSLLKSQFSNTQFVLTTHDGVWMRHMRTAQLIKSKAGIELRGWDVDHGPAEWITEDVWAEIDGHVAKNDIRAAAGLLRFHLEHLAAELCDLLGGRVEFRGDGRYELGDLLPAAIGAMNSLLGKAKAAANSWARKDLLTSLAAQEAMFKQAAANANIEQWQINPAVHYNAWANFQRQDFAPVVAAFKALELAFRCADCSELLYTASTGKTKDTLRCGCGRVSYGLVPKRA